MRFFITIYEKKLEEKYKPLGPGGGGVYPTLNSAAGPELYCLQPQKGLAIRIFNQAFKIWERIVSRTNVAEI